MFFLKGTPSGEDTGVGLRRAGDREGNHPAAQAKRGSWGDPVSWERSDEPFSKLGVKPPFASIGRSEAWPAPSRCQDTHTG